MNTQKIIDQLNAAREAFDAGKTFTGYGHLDHVEALVKADARQGTVVARYTFAEQAARAALDRTIAASDGAQYFAEADGETFVVVAYQA